MIKKFSIESIVLSVICLADLLSTIFLVSYRGCMEGNPLMNYYLSHGIAVFCCAKLILFIFPIFIIEYARQRRPLFTKYALRTCIGIYLAAYVTTVIQLNGLPDLTGNRTQLANAPVSAAMVPAK